MSTLLQFTLLKSVAALTPDLHGHGLVVGQRDCACLLAHAMMIRSFKGLILLHLAILDGKRSSQISWEFKCLVIALGTAAFGEETETDSPLASLQVVTILPHRVHS